MGTPHFMNKYRVQRKNIWFLIKELIYKVKKGFNFQTSSNTDNSLIPLIFHKVESLWTSLSHMTVDKIPLYLQGDP